MTALATLRAVSAEKDRVAKQVQTGYRVAGFDDDAAVFAVAQGIRSRQAASHSVDSSLARAAGALETALAGIADISELLIRLKERAMLAMDGTLTEDQRNYIQNDADAYLRQVTQIANAAFFDRISLISPEPVSAQTFLTAQASLGAAPGAFGPRSGPQPPNVGNESNDFIAPPSAGDPVYLGIPLRVGDQGLRPIRGEFTWSFQDSLGNTYPIGTQSFDLPTGLPADSVYYITPSGAGVAGPDSYSWPSIPGGAEIVWVTISGRYTYPTDAPDPDEIEITRRSIARVRFGRQDNTTVVTNQALNIGPFQQQISISGHQITNSTAIGRNDTVNLSPLTISINPVGSPAFGSGGEAIEFDVVVNGSTVLTGQQFTYGPPFTYTLPAGYNSFAAPAVADEEIDYEEDRYTPVHSKASQTIEFTNFRYNGVPAAGSVTVSDVAIENTVWAYDGGIPRILPDPLFTPLDVDGAYTVTTRRDMTAVGLGLYDLDFGSVQNAQDALLQVEGAIAAVNAAMSRYAAKHRFITSQRDIVAELREAAQKGLGALVDADIAHADAVLKSQGVREQLALQSLNIANRFPSKLLGLLR